MALLIHGMKCGLCSETLDIDGPFFATTHLRFENDPHRLSGRTDGAWHWDCYARWEHQPEFASLVTAALAHELPESWVIMRRPGRYLLMMHLTVQAEVQVVPEATGDTVSVLLRDWSTWLDDVAKGRFEKKHPFADSAIADVASELGAIAGDEDSLVRLFGADAIKRHRLIRTATQRLCPELPTLLDRCCANGLRPMAQLEDDNRRLSVFLAFSSENGTRPVQPTGGFMWDEESVIWTCGGPWNLQNEGLYPYYAPRALRFELASANAALDAALAYHNVAPVIIEGMAVPLHRHPSWTVSSVSSCLAGAMPFPKGDLDGLKEEQHRAWAAAGKPIVGAGAEKHVSILLSADSGRSGPCLMRLDLQKAWRVTA